MRNIPELMVTILSKIKFYELWRDFHSFPFAIYNQENVYLSDGRIIPWDNRFIGNTAIEFEDSFLAIWSVNDSNKIDLEYFSANLIHEMFHAFQHENNEKRWPSELEGLRYSYEAECLNIKYYEAQLLIEMLQTFDHEKFELFLQLRKYRSIKYPNDFIYETKIEVVEGMAEFVELKALQQLDIEKHNKKITKIKESILKKDLYFSMRRLSYHMGSLFLLLCEHNNIDVSHDISIETRTIFDLVFAAREYRNPSITVPDLFSQKVIVRKAEIRKVIEEKQRTLHQQKEGVFPLVGFDPLNTTQYEDILYCKHFVAFIENNEVVFFQQESLAYLDKENRITKIQFNNNQKQ